MSTDKPEDSGVVMSFLFTTFTEQEMQHWIDVGYFKDHSDIAACAFGMVQKAVRFLEQDKQVIDFNLITIEMEVSVPEENRKHSLQ